MPNRKEAVVVRLNGNLKLWFGVAMVAISAAIAWGVLTQRVSHLEDDHGNTRGKACNAEDAAMKNEGDIRALRNSVTRIERTQERMDDKLDKILEKVK